MKKNIFLIFFSFVIFTLSGCQTKYGTVESFKACDSEKEMSLSVEDANVIVEIWNNGNWEKGNTRNTFDYEFLTNDGTVVKYSTECAVFNDHDNERYLAVLKKEQNQINAILEKYLVSIES